MALQVLLLFILFPLSIWGLLVIAKREERNAEQKIASPHDNNDAARKALAKTPANTPTSDTRMIIDRCEGCRCLLDPPRVAAGEYVADDVMQHFCTTECFDRIIDLSLPFYYHKGKTITDDFSAMHDLEEHYGYRAANHLKDKYLKDDLKTEVYTWNQKKEREIEEIINRWREHIRERYQRKAGVIDTPPHRSYWRGYCYACGRRIPINYDVRKSFPVLPRGDTYWFCSMFCYTRMFRAWVPFGWRYEHDNETPADAQQRGAYFREAEPKLLAYLENVENEEGQYQPDLPEWIPSPDPPIIRTIKKPTADRCLKCGTAEKSDRADPVPDTPFWYCSNECSREATEEFVPERWKGDPYDNNSEWKAYMDSYYLSREEARKRYMPHYLAAYDNARNIVEARLRAEFRKQEAEEAEKENEMREREWEKDYIAAEKEHEQFLTNEAFQESLEPKPIPQQIRYEHTHIIGPSGSGKTSLIQQLILLDLDIETEPRLPPAYVVIDPKGLMLERLRRLKVFHPSIGWYPNNLVVIDPTQSPLPALDLFHQPPIPMTEQQRARVRNQLIDTFAYIFSTADARLTQRQSIPFGYVVRLVFSMGGNIDTLMDILEDNAKERRFYPHMQKLGEQDRGARRFFDNDFYSVGFNDTRQQIKTRLYEIISKPELIAMLAAGQNKLSMFDCLQQRKIVLVNTAMPQLGSAASQLLGRYFIAMTLNAAFARSAIPKDQWTPAYLVIDEFQDFADEEKTPEMLRLAREYNLGITIAHQNLFCAELNDALRNAISTNTSIKYAASPEGNDLSYMARDMRCESDFLKTMTKHGNIAKFACYVRGMGLTHPFTYDVELGFIDRWPKMPDDVYARSMQMQRAALQPDPQVIQKPQQAKQDVEQQSPPETHKPLRESNTPTQPPAKSAPTAHTGDHTEPASKWGDE